MTRRAKEVEQEQTYTSPLPASRAIETDAYQELATRLWELSCQMHHLADLLTAYGWQGAGAAVRSNAREAAIQARAMAGNTDRKLPDEWASQEIYWRSRTVGRLRVVW